MKKAIELVLCIPTFNGHLFAAEIEQGQMPEFGSPHVPVLVREEAGIRIVLGTRDYEDSEKPDIKIERHPKGWAIFLHPAGGGDPSAFVYLLDDGRSFLVKDFPGGSADPIEVLEPNGRIPEIHGPE